MKKIYLDISMSWALLINKEKEGKTNSHFTSKKKYKFEN